ncbi:hypothetical protein LTS18_012678 [Coniosporium uncinatum]|uniref:Uncharacterized protein n=1 Tax=Coniosporium uncinatum TaxID=93489 RepID=A0ACC3DJ36_9PEZI|nr:hypothetical protein LTS18_012678 [Coniosporium uncinatum]
MAVSETYTQALRGTGAHVSMHSPPVASSDRPKSPEHGHYIDSWLKMQTFRLHQMDSTIKRCIVLSPEQLIWRSLNDLFKLPAVDLAAPRAYWVGNDTLSTNLVVVAPSERLWKLVELRLENYEHSHGIVNDLFKRTALYLPGSYATRISHWELWDMPVWYRPEEVEELDALVRSIGAIGASITSNVERQRPGEVAVMEHALNVWSTDEDKDTKAVNTTDENPVALENPFFAALAAKASASAAAVAAEESLAAANGTNTLVATLSDDEKVDQPTATMPTQLSQLLRRTPQGDEEPLSNTDKIAGLEDVAGGVSDTSSIHQPPSTATESAANSRTDDPTAPQTELPHFMEAAPDSPANEALSSEPPASTPTAAETAPKNTDSAASVTQPMPPAPWTPEGHPNAQPLHSLSRVAHVILYATPTPEGNSRIPDTLSGPWTRRLGPPWSETRNTAERERSSAHAAFGDLWDEWWNAAKGRMRNLDDMWEGCPGDVSLEGFHAVGLSEGSVDERGHVGEGRR